MRPGEQVYIKAAPEITGTVCFIRDGRFTVAYPPSDEQRRKGRRAGVRYSYPLSEAHRFDSIRSQPRIVRKADRTYEEQD